MSKRSVPKRAIKRKVSRARQSRVETDLEKLQRSEEKLERRLREQAATARFSLDALQARSVQTICDDAAHILGRELNVDFSAVFELLPTGKTLLLRAGYGWRSGHVGLAQIDVSEETATGRALQLNQPIIISDLRADRQVRLPRFMRDHKVFSSMAVVLQGRQHAFGVLSVDSVAPRIFGPDEVHFLESIGNVLATAVSRVQFEHEFRDTAARLRAIVDTAVDGIITINERGIVETMNPAAERIFGYDAKEVIGRNVSMLMPEPYRSEHDSYLKRYLRTGERRIIGIGREVRGARKDGAEFALDLAVSATSLGNRRIFTGLLRDITARKKLEQELLEIADREQRRIGSDLHDDLCQRLAGIRFACDALKKTIGKALPDEIARQIGKIGTDVSEAIEHTRMLARGLAPVALDAQGLVSALHELTEVVPKLFGVKCIYRGEENLAIRDPLVATHLYRIAQEAINNALKHGHPSQMIVSLKRSDDKAVLTVEDNGAGFSPPEASKSTEGMGLRTIAYRAGMIDAGLQIESSPGKGTKIICTFSREL
jgi:PAS domain S-box-containing protein